MTSLGTKIGHCGSKNKNSVFLHCDLFFFNSEVNRLISLEHLSHTEPIATWQSFCMLSKLDNTMVLES